jgi:hypothetical protein
MYINKILKTVHLLVVVLLKTILIIYVIIRTITVQVLPVFLCFLPLSLPDTTTVYDFQSLPGIAGLFRMASPLAASHIRAHSQRNVLVLDLPPSDLHTRIT